MGPIQITAGGNPGMMGEVRMPLQNPLGPMPRMVSSTRFSHCGKRSRSDVQREPANGNAPPSTGTSDGEQRRHAPIDALQSRHAALYLHANGP